MALWRYGPCSASQVLVFEAAPARSDAGFLLLFFWRSPPPFFKVHVGTRVEVRGQLYGVFFVVFLYVAGFQRFNSGVRLVCRVLYPLSLLQPCHSYLGLGEGEYTLLYLKVTSGSWSLYLSFLNPGLSVCNPILR